MNDTIETNIFKCFIDSPSPLGARTIARRLSIKRATVLRFCSNSSFLENVDPVDVGSYKTGINVFKYVGEV